MKTLVLVLFLLISAQAQPRTADSFLAASLSDQEIERLAHSPEWLRLLHYKKRLWIFHYVSELDGEEFFFAENGKYDPVAELKANLPVYSQDLKVGRLKQHPQCAFPERFRFFKKSTGLSIPEVQCPQLENFLKRFKAESVALVFSTAYPNNPGSMFGHTFLRINSGKAEDGTKRMDLLDNGLSFAAFVPPEEAGGVIYATLGLFGGYRGQFSMLPYYAKVNEYISSESRDLWEYNLDLNREETLRLLRHTWEIETNTHFWYYFFDENCAYHLLSLIEYAKPEWKLTSYDWFVLPSDTVKVLDDIPGAVTSVKFRPSLKKQLYQKTGAMTPKEKKQFKELVLDNKTSLIETIDNTFLLDTAALYYSFQKREHSGQLSAEASKTFDRVLRHRASLPASSHQRSLPDIEKNNRPEIGHDMYKVGLRTGRVSNDQNRLDTDFTEFHFKFSHHDLMNLDAGYEPFSELNLPSLSFRKTGTDKLRLEKLEIASVTSLTPVTFLESNRSWRITLDHRRAHELKCNNCYVSRARTGAGYTFALARRWWIYALASLDVELGSELPNGYFLGTEFKIASIFSIGDIFKMHLQITPLVRAIPISIDAVATRLSWQNAFYLSTHWDLQLEFHTTRAHIGAYQDFDEGMVSLHHYF